MEVKKIVRKATAVAASASFIGATLLGAVAQDLAKYPAPFVKDGQFDAYIVVGADAQPADVVGAVDVGASLQFALKKQAGINVGAAEATISEGLKIQKAGEKFNYGDSIASVQDGSAITGDDLPEILSDGKYVESQGANKNSVSYTQKVYFNSNETAALTFTQRNKYADDANDYLYISKNKELYNFVLDFDSDVEYTNTSSTTANDDFKTTTITIQGQTYTITDVALTAGKISKITMLSGEAVLWLTQNNPIEKTVNGVEHKIEVLDVTEGADACQVKIDDVTAIIDVDQVKTINGVQIGITDARAIHAQLQDVDVCQISIGATELTLENGREVKIDDVKLDGSTTTITDAGGALQAIEVSYTPKDQDNDLYLKAGKEFIDPIFRSWKIVNGGISADYVTYEAESTGDQGSFDFINNAGKAISIPIWLNETSARVKLGTGEEAYEQVLGATALTGGLYSGFANNCTSTSLPKDVTDCEGVMILASTSSGEAHMLEVSNINTNDNKVDIKSLTTGSLYKDVSYVDGNNTVMTLGSLGNIVNLNINETAGTLTVVNSLNGKIETNTLGSLDINATSPTVVFKLSEQNRNNQDKIADEMNATVVTIVAKQDTTNTDEIDLEVSLSATNITWSGWNAASGVKLAKDSDYKVYVTDVGTKVTVDEKNDDSVKIEMPKAEVYANIFVAPTLASVSTAAGGMGAYTISKLNVGAAKLDSEITDATASNLILVGGPCANKITAQVLGKTYPACGASSGIAQDTGMIKAVAQSSGKVALVVAGWEAIDTRRATRVLANYEAYGLSGDMVEVTGTSLTNIQVKKSA